MEVPICCGKEPECPFGSPKIDLADLDGRCDRFWICEDGLISDTFCSSGSGFDATTKTCHDKAPCLQDSPSGIERPAGLARIVDILVTKYGNIHDKNYCLSRQFSCTHYQFMLNVKPPSVNCNVLFFQDRCPFHRQETALTKFKKLWLALLHQ